MEPLEAHAQLFGLKAPPSDRQKAFYVDENARGFSSKEKDPELTDAVLIRAMAQVVDKAAPPYHEVFFFFPEADKAWVVSRIHNLATTTMTRMQSVLKQERGKKAILHVRKWLEVIRLGPIEGWKKGEAPEKWVAFGYDKSDPNLPEWLKAGLV